MLLNRGIIIVGVDLHLCIYIISIIGVSSFVGFTPKDESRQSTFIHLQGFTQVIQ